MNVALHIAVNTTPIRSWRERLAQTLCFEALGLATVSPLFALLSGTRMSDAVLVLVALSAVVMAWASVYNTAFDLIEARAAHRVASDRPQRWRVLHAIGSEVSVLVLTWPLLVALTPMGWLDALVAEIGLTLIYAVYGYLFHLAFDRLRPVRMGPRSNP